VKEMMVENQKVDCRL